jgi:hypothetical protein
VTVRRWAVRAGVAVAIAGLLSSCSDDSASQGQASGDSALCVLSAGFSEQIYDTGGEMRAGYIASVEGLLEAEVLDDESETLARAARAEVRRIEPVSSTVGVNAYIATLGADSAAVGFTNHLTPLLEDECWTDGPNGTEPFIDFEL